MKQISSCHAALAVCFTLCLSTTVFGQIEKGASLFSGGTSLGNTSISSGGNSTSFFNLDLKGGYFFVDNFAGGVLFDHISSGNSSTTGIGIFFRYYIQGKFFLGAGFQSWSYGGGGNSQTQIPMEAGYAIFVNRSIAVEPSLKYTTYDGGSSLNIGVCFTVFLGRS